MKGFGIDEELSYGELIFSSLSRTPFKTIITSILPTLSILSLSAATFLIIQKFKAKLLSLKKGITNFFKAEEKAAEKPENLPLYPRLTTKDGRIIVATTAQTSVEWCLEEGGNLCKSTVELSK